METPSWPIFRLAAAAATSGRGSPFYSLGSLAAEGRMENETIAKLGKANVWVMVFIMNITGWFFPIFFPSISIRIYQELFPPYVEQIANLNQHIFVDYGHRILGGILFLLGAFQFESTIRKSAPKTHRFSGYLYILLGFFISLSAAYMAIAVPFSGFTESVLVVAISFVYVAYLSLALKSALFKKFASHREWMIRGYAVASFIYVMRIFSSVFYHVGVHATGPEIFIASSTLAFGLNCFVAEWWINRTKSNLYKSKT